MTNLHSASHSSSSNIVELSFLNTISKKITESIAPKTVAETALKGFMELVSADVVRLFLCDGVDLILQHQEYAKPELKHSLDHIGKVGHCVCGLAAKDKAPLFLLDSKQHNCCAKSECRKQGITSLAAIPLIHQSEVIGVVSIGSLQPLNFKERALFLDNFANLMAVSLSMSLLVKSLNAKIEALEISEKKLIKSESNYRSVIDNIQDVFYRTDLKGNLIMASPSGAQLLGYDTLKELIGRPVTSFWFEPEKRTEFLEKIEKYGKVADYELTLKHKDGSPIEVSSSSRFYFDSDGNIAGVEDDTSMGEPSLCFSVSS